MTLTHDQHYLLIAVTPAVNRTGVDVNLKSVINSTRVLYCPVTGVPTPRVDWMKDGKLIDLRRGSNIELRDAGRQLVIHSVSLADNATYRCLASNPAGQDFIDFDLEVHGTANLFVVLCCYTCQQ